MSADQKQIEYISQKVSFVQDMQDSLQMSLHEVERSTNAGARCLRTPQCNRHIPLETQWFAVLGS